MPSLRDKIADRTAHVAIIGLGYVGLPLATAFAKAGFRVTGLDVDRQKVDAIVAGRSYIPDVPDDDLASHVQSGRLIATSDYDALRQVDAIFICVPTPYDAQRAPDLSYIQAASRDIEPRLRPGQLVVLQSTTYPGTTEEIVQPILEQSGLKAGEDFNLAFSPERIDPGNKQWTAYNTPKVVGGLTPECTRLAADLLQQMGAPVHVVSSPRAAELTKLLENTFRAVNIALVNELALLTERMGIDLWEVVEAARTKPFGFMPFYPGPGVGGHCLSPDEYIFVRNGNGGLETVLIGDYFQGVRTAPDSRLIQAQGTTLIAPADTELLVFDPAEERAIFKPLRYVSARPYEGQMVQVVTADGRRLTVTDGHPMVTLERGEFLVKRADGLKPKDAIVIAKDLPDDLVPLSVDLIAELPESEYEGVRVKPKRETFSAYRAQLVLSLKGHLKYYWDVFRYNTMPLATYVALEREGTMPIPHQDVLLCTGRGPSYGSIPAVLSLDADFARLLGYYLSEGCITADQSLRTRFTFNTDERETIADLEAILKHIGLKYSAYKDRRWNAYHIKVSSQIFGLLIRDILQCGTNSYNMQIPPRLMTAPTDIRLALLSGLLRGDGDVHHIQEMRSYTRRGKEYTHYINTATAGYFSISPILFQQTVLLLQGLGFVPTFKHDKPQLRLYGAEQLARLKPLLADVKRQRLEAYEQGRRKRMPTKQSQDHGCFATVQVREVAPAPSVPIVYSLETDEPHTFVTSYGMVVHNCIPVDPYYLSWKAREYDYYTEFIELAGEVNQAMTYHVVDLVCQGLSLRGKPLRDARVLVLGVAFKPDIDDAR
ncbi:MAG: nucleotide sugar dehydrogenase, partial [Anaerolineae bacterium]|nr:nucleotide sugar dehydrogenase [Anaerolineae bacterium]